MIKGRTDFKCYRYSFIYLSILIKNGRGNYSDLQFNRARRTRKLANKFACGKRLSVAIDSLQGCLQRLQTTPSKLLTRFLIMWGKVAKLPSKEHPLELLETVDAIADHSLLQISRRKRGEAYFKRFKTLSKRKRPGKNHMVSNFIHVLLHYVDIWSQKVQHSVLYNAFHSIDDLNQA